MAIYKSKLTLFFIMITFSACHLVTQDESSGIGLAPDPIFNKSRTMVVMPILLPEGNERNKYIWLGTDIETTIFNYLQFIQEIPGDINNTIIDNSKDIWDFYGISKPKPEKKKEMLEKTLTDNKEHWLKITPEDEKTILKRYLMPELLNINIIQGKETSASYFDKGYIVAQVILTENSVLKFNIYDPIASKTLIEWDILIPKGISRGNNPDQIIAINLLKKKMAQTIQELTTKEIVELSLPKMTNDMSVFIDGKLVLTPSVFLTQGKHQVYVSQLGDIIYGGSINAQKSGELDIEQALKNQKGQKILLNTNPNNTPIFIDEKYIGLSPLSITLPDGIHYLRASNLGYAHLNYILDVDSYQPIKELTLNLMLEDQAYINRVKSLRSLKLGSFFAGILSFGAVLYSFERAGFYENKIMQNVDVAWSQKRYTQFTAVGIAFGGVGGALIITALVTQILEYQARDIGIGVDSDGNLGFTYRF